MDTPIILNIVAFIILLVSLGAGCVALARRPRIQRGLPTGAAHSSCDGEGICAMGSDMILVIVQCHAKINTNVVWSSWIVFPFYLGIIVVGIVT